MTMNQVLLVDDEPLARHNLLTLMDWGRHGFEVSGEAYNGQMALEMIEQSPPHIAIIDVSMPEMNGVELNRAIRERYPAVQTIMLSSYDDYDYVRECLMNGAVDYVLKHRLSESALVSILNRAIGGIRPGNGSAESSVSRNPAAIRDALAEAARGKPGAAQELEVHASQLGLYPRAVSYAAAAVQITPFRLLTESFSDVQTSRLAQQAVDLMQQSLGDIRERTAAYVGDGRLIICFAFQERSELAAVGEASRMLSKIRHSFELFLNLNCIYALGHVCGSLSQLGASYAAADRALDPAGERESGTRQQRVSLTIEEQKQLLLFFERLDEEGLRGLITSVFHSVRELSAHSRAVQTIVSELLQTGDKAWKKWMPSTDAAMSGLPPRSDVGKLASIGELERWLQRYYSELIGRLKLKRVTGSYSRHVTQAVRYILEKYQESVTLEQAAGEIGLNPSYLSRIFKEETRSTFSEYLNRIRIEASCKLLESGQYSVKQVSGQVGFTTHNYFFKVFKELTGQTPQDYIKHPDRNKG